MDILNVQPTDVFFYFKEISDIARGSGNTAKISEYLVSFAKKHSLYVRADELGNVIMKREASSGYENASPVILQGHMDMVAVKTSFCNKDMEREGLDVIADGDWIYAKDTSLGGDDGIALAFILAVFADDTLSHPPLEAIFTVDEEIGMLGAVALDVSDINGKMLLNIDSEEEGIFTVSCAGGTSIHCNLPYTATLEEGLIATVTLDGLHGGHSGVEIDGGYANAIALMGRILAQTNGGRIISVDGGEKDNAIADSCIAKILLPKDSGMASVEKIKEMIAVIQKEYEINEPNMHGCVTTEFGSANALCQKDSDALIMMLYHCMQGVIRRNPVMTDMVQTSINLGIVRTGDTVSFTYLVRSASTTEKEDVVARLKHFTEYLNGSIETSGDYPGWEYRKDSLLRDIMVREYEAIYGHKPIVEGIHAGLECGVFASKIDDLDCISFGPDIKNIHTTKERMSISSVERTYTLIKRTLAALR